MLELIARLAAPSGIIWISIAGLTVAAGRDKKKKTTIGLALLFALYSLAGNVWFSTFLNFQLEKDYRDFDVSRSPEFDAIVVLGGGSSETPTGQPQLDSEGDRIMLAARLFFRGQTKYLVCTGRVANRELGAPQDAADTTAALLSQVGVPEDRIMKIGGRFTKEEMHEVKRLMADHDWDNVGLITSAWHMRRAMRHAKDSQLEIYPLPADFHSTKNKQARSLIDLIPSSTGFRHVELAYREFLAEFANR